MKECDSDQAVPGKRRVFLVDDHPVTREGFCQLLELEPDLLVCGQAGTVPLALAGIKTAKPEIVVLDIAMPGRDGLELIKDLGVLQPELPTLVLSTMDEAVYAKRSLMAGAKGYVMKYEPIARLLQAVREVLAGEIYLSAAMRTQLLLASLNFSNTDPTRGVNSLSDRELEVFRLLGNAIGTQEIAKTLNLSLSTVETHRGHIKDKLGIKHAPDLMRQAVIWLQGQSCQP